ncbi:hypothetical protein [Diaphorobacter sp.]|uniref:hypothetical protein n=1 Tax=Diaphorobacter sp. TaxID=1934310 RepID=UPI0028AF1A2E|nr:hypothetical protein [Diaphorobacter sp.]
MNILPNEEIDIDRFRKEVLANAGESALPCNMSTEWLTLFIRDFTEALEHPDSPCITRTREALTTCLALILHLLGEKQSTRQVAVPLDQMFEYCRQYQMELQLELIRRRSAAPLIPATLETILTNRVVSQQEPGRPGADLALR